MDVSDLCVGLLFKWNNYPFSRSDLIKPRYCIYLGKTPGFAEPFHYLVTGTSQIHYYEPGGSREGAKKIFFDAGKYNLPLLTVFDIDLDFKEHEDQTIGCRCHDMEIISNLSSVDLQSLFIQIAQSSRISLRIKRDISHCFKQHGVTGLCPIRSKIPKYKIRLPTR